MAASNVWSWRDNFEYQTLTLQNQKVAYEKQMFSNKFDFYDQITTQSLSHLLRQVRCFVTCWVESSIISSDSNLTQNIIRESIDIEKKKEMGEDSILMYSRGNDTLGRWFVLWDNL